MTQSPPYIFRIGVTGHRNLKDPTAVALAVDRMLNCLKQLFHKASEGTPVTNWVAVSPLAKGADRIVAKVVLEQPDSRLEVVSPLPLDEYRKDFADRQDREEFEQLLKLDSAPTELNPLFQEDSIGNEKEARKDAYLKVGRRVVDSCELLIVIWDGQLAEGRGGTGDIVRFALDQNRKTIWIDARDPSKPPLWLTKRPSGLAGHGPQPGMWTQTLPQDVKQLSLGYHRLEAYQRDTAFDASAAKVIEERHSARLYKFADAAGLSRDVVHPIIEQIVPLYARADQLARHYNQFYVFAAVWLFQSYRAGARRLWSGVCTCERTGGS